MAATALDTTTALVVIDLQKGLSQYPLLHPFSAVVANTVRLIDAFAERKLPIVLVTVAFSPDGGDVPRRRTEVPPRALPSSADFSELVPELAGAPGALRIVKRQPTAFFGTELDLQLRRRRVTGIVLTGVATGSGVEATARDAWERSYNVTFASDAITDSDQVAHDFAMQRSFPRLGEIDTTDAILALVRASAGTPG